MSGFRQKILGEYQFDGDDVVVELSPLTRGEFLALLPYFEDISSAGKAIEAGEREPTGAEVDKLMQAIDNIDLNARILEVRGLVDAEQNPLSKDVVMSNSYFIPLLSMIFTTLMTESSMSEEEAGNSNVQRLDSGGGSPRPRKKTARSRG